MGIVVRNVAHLQLLGTYSIYTSGLQVCIQFEDSHTVKIDNLVIQYVNSFKYLGIETDKNINMKGQYKYLYKIVNHKFFLLRLIRPCLTIQAALSIARSMILTAPNHQLCERQDRCSIFTVLCYFRYFVRE